MSNENGTLYKKSWTVIMASISDCISHVCECLSCVYVPKYFVFKLEYHNARLGCYYIKYYNILFQVVIGH